MKREPLVASVEAVQRLAVTKQHLSGELPPRPTTRTILSVVRDLGYVQWDPVSVVAPSHVLSLRARLGAFRVSDLDRLLWHDRRLLLHWTPMASIVLTADYPLFGSLMHRYPESLSHSWNNQRTHARTFLASHRALRTRILTELRTGPLQVGQFQDHGRNKRDDGEWNPTSDLSLMLYHLLMAGEVMVVGHRGNQNLWGLSEQFLPSWVDREVRSEESFESEAAQRALRALGTATPAEITYYFVRGRYERLPETLARLEEAGTIRRVAVDGWGPRDERYILVRDIPLLESITAAEWHPRLSLLPPFDNLICSTARTKRLFDFDYVREQFLPAAKRKFGTYVLPILWGEKLIGRIDPRLDKARGVLVINAVHAEPGAPRDPEVGAHLRATLERLAAFLGAGTVTYPSRVPEAWRSSLR